MSTGYPKPFRPRVRPLEAREVPAIVSATLTDGYLAVYSDDTGNNFRIEQTAAAVIVQEIVSNDTRVFARSAVNRVDVFGGAGDDTFTTAGDSGLVIATHGRMGNDKFFGGPGQDAMYGGQGRDRMYGGAGADVIFGAKGSDFIVGDDGRDLLYGGMGNDTVNGGQGTDGITGGQGNDVLIGIDGGTSDTLDAGAGTDVLWYDLNGALTDGVTGITGEDFTRAVAGFVNGADRTLNGDRIADPALPPRLAPLTPFQYEEFDQRPLFATAGPALDDVLMSFTPGLLGAQTPVLNDAWLLSGVASMVDAFQTLITTNMVDFGDGTYGVRLNGTYVRVDNDLPVTQLDLTNPAFARLGADDSVWVAVLEKTFATITSTTAPSYAFLENPPSPIAPTVFPNAAFATFGGSAFFRLSNSFASATQLGNFTAAAVASNVPVTFTPLAAPAVGVPLLNGRSYSVLSFTTDALGNAATFTLRNPTGVDGAGSIDADPNDGLVTVTTAQLFAFAANGRLDFGDFSTV